MVEVIAQKWEWKFRYEDGYVGSGEMVLPGDNGREAPVHVVFTSKDVIHCFYCPEFRMKKYVVPGRRNELWVSPIYDPADAFHVATRTLEDPEDRDERGVPRQRKFVVDEYQVRCAEYCGQGHSRMIGRIIVVDPKEYPTYMRLLAAQPRPASSPAAAEPVLAAF